MATNNRFSISAHAALVGMFSAACVFADETNDLIAEALSAAPEAIASIATVKNFDGTVLKDGSPEWVCYPSNPNLEGFCPMCLDRPWQQWFNALAAGEAPQIVGLGVSYMLQGDCAVSNKDPVATERTDDNDWVKEGPHLMILTPHLDSLKGLISDPYKGEPYVMWGDTPYAHIMAPIPGGN